jgi:hypothetical protein
LQFNFKNKSNNVCFLKIYTRSLNRVSTRKQIKIQKDKENNINFKIKQ